MAMVECGKWKIKKLFDKIAGSKEDASAVLPIPDFKRYTVMHSIQDKVVRVSIYDNKVKACAVKYANKHNVGLYVNFKELFVDVEEPSEYQIENGVTLEQKISEAYVKMESTAHEMNHEEEKPYRIAEAVKKFEATRGKT